jgi:hypothetical protein
MLYWNTGIQELIRKYEIYKNESEKFKNIVFLKFIYVLKKLVRYRYFVSVLLIVYKAKNILH